MKSYCFITGAYSRYDVLMFERQGKSLVDAGFKVYYLVCDDKPDEKIDGINIISTKYLPKNRFERFFKTRNKLLSYAQKINADIYQISDPELISLINPLKKLGKKVTFNLREFYPRDIKSKKYLPKVFRLILAKQYEMLMKRYFPLYDAVFVTTDWVWEILFNQWNLKKTFIITNFPRVNHEFYLNYEEYLGRNNVLGYEGTIYEQSRQEIVFDALEELPTVNYFLAGKMTNDYFNKLQSHPYWNKVEFKNGFKLQELNEIFSKMSIANVFRDFGTSPGSYGVLKIFESMEAALPVLLADVPLYREINEKWHCGICVNPNNKDSIKQAIDYLIQNKYEAYIMGQNGRKAVVEEYNWDVQAKKYIEIINNL